MDPNATLAIWREATARYFALCDANDDPDDAASDDIAGALREALDAADDLVTWLDGGGFAPQWKGSR